MVRPELVVDLRTAIYKARREGVAVRRDEVRFEDQGRPAAVRLEVPPARAAQQEKNRTYWSCFRSPIPRGSRDARKSGQAGARRKHPSGANELHRELAATQDQLRGLICRRGNRAGGDGKAVNEEEKILSSNEELQSTNEELETAKEELQSANEELVTHQRRVAQHHNDELTILTNDLGNLLVGVDIPGAGAGRRSAGAALHSSGGRPVEPDSGRRGPAFQRSGFEPERGRLREIFAPVVRDGDLIEREVRDLTDHRYSLRVRPYKAADANQIEGVLVVLLDVDVIYRARRTKHRSPATSRAPLSRPFTGLWWWWTREYRVLSVNRSFCELFRVSREGRGGKTAHGTGRYVEWRTERREGRIAERCSLQAPGDTTGAGDAAGGAPGDAVRGGRWSLPWAAGPRYWDARQRNVDIKDFEVEQEIQGWAADI